VSEAGRHCFIPMQPEHLDWVGECEAELHAFPWTRGNFVDSMAAGHGSWLMKEGTQNIGYAIVLGVLDEAHLLNISIARAAQGRGHGRRLLDWLHDQARSQGATQFFLEVRPSNETALTLYRSMGFEQIGRRRGYYPGVDGREDAIVMRRGL
jgi:ribosomal-protein-alanine N-acetyltransferase